MTEGTPATAADSTSNSSPTRRMLISVGLYTLARLGLVAVLAAVILGIGSLVLDGGLPLLVGLLFAALLAMPLSIVLFKSLRVRVNADIADYSAGRQATRDELRARLRGEQAE